MRKLGSISYEVSGQGAPLVLVHGAFSDHRSNWEFVLPAWQREFQVYAIARRGRGESLSSQGHSVEEEAEDLVHLLRSLDQPVALLGHSYGAHVALAAARIAPDRVARLLLYEAPHSGLLASEMQTRLANLVGHWDRFAETFFADVLLVPPEELRPLRASALWAPIVADAPASWQDLQAIARYRFVPSDFAGLSMPIQLQTGTESPQHLYATDDLATVLPHAQVLWLEGQAHEAMTTAPDLYARHVAAWLR